ncbi:hypothetical protein [Streptomyces sp. NRRL F-5630]|uniref:hypothetical protein n=1 Tax=Streptomyces sp. NRRL F-5630 TaxID=1463864 RepID=UPI003D74642B
MSLAFYSDAAEKTLHELTRSEQAAVESVRRRLAEQPSLDGARTLPDHGTGSRTFAYELLPEQTNGRGISVVYRHAEDLDAVLILWLIAGP